MYEVPTYQPEIRLIGNDGSVVTYNNYQEFISSIDYYFVEKHVVTTMKDWPTGWFVHWQIGENRYPKYIVRDEFGSVFSQSEILHDARELRRINYIMGRFYNRRHNFVFRATPVPYTGKSKWRFKYYYKRPKTTQERRWGYAHDVKYVRGKRRPHILPNSWEDEVRSDVRLGKSWKHYKKEKQWM